MGRYWLMIVVLITATIVVHRLSHPDAIALQKPLHEFPRVLDSRRAHDFPIDESVLRVAAMDEYLNRTYEDVAHQQGMPISLYVGYYKSQLSGRSIHSPRNCLPGAGWEPESRTILQLQLPEGRKAPVNLYSVRKGLDRELVLYWYQSNDRIIASEYWAEIYLVLDAVRYHRSDAALIRIVTPIWPDERSAYERATGFASESMGPLQSILPR